MCKFNRKLAAIVAAIFMSNGHAGGDVPGGQATEFTQALNNVELVAQVKQSVLTVKQLVASYLVQYKHLQEAILAGIPIPAGEVIRTVQGVRNEINAAQRYMDDLKRVGSSVDQIKSKMDQRAVEAQLSNLTFEQYVAREKAKIADGDARARQRLDAEQMALDQANEDMALAQEHSAAIAGTVGIHESMGLLNTQINRLITQNARMSAMMAQQIGRQEHQKINDDIIARQQHLELQQAIARGQKDGREKVLKDIRGMSVKPIAEPAAK